MSAPQEISTWLEEVSLRLWMGGEGEGTYTIHSQRGCMLQVTLANDHHILKYR